MEAIIKDKDIKRLLKETIIDMIKERKKNLLSLLKKQWQILAWLMQLLKVEKMSWFLYETSFKKDLNKISETKIKTKLKELLVD